MLFSLLGTLPQWLTVVALVGGGWLVSRGSAGPALQIERQANKTLQERNVQLEHELKAAHLENASLRTRTDLEPMQVAILDRMTVHEQRAQDRFEKTTGVLALIADRLGPEDGP